MRGLIRWLGRLLLIGVVVIAGLAVPSVWIELGCRPQGDVAEASSLLPPRYHRAEARTLLTYPEWHIVHAYDDFAATIREGDPHEFGYVEAVGGYWSSLCQLSRASGPMGGIDGSTKQLVHTIGISFTAEMMLKAAYEETIGRLAAMIRGEERAPLDDLSADQAGDYAAFLTQTPWYLWDFRADSNEFVAAAGSTLRDRERRVALRLEYRAKAAYAGVIERAVAEVGLDQLSMRSVVSGASASELSRIEGVQIVGSVASGIVIETARYRAFTELAKKLSSMQVTFAEIAGNDQIMLAALSTSADEPGALLSLPRQGRDDYRHLFLMPVADLTGRIASMRDGALQLEHIHDY